MSDRYGYGDRRGNREDDTYDQYGEWHSNYLGSNRSSSGAGAYSNRAGRTTSRRMVDARDSSERRASASDRGARASSRRAASERASSGNRARRSSQEASRGSADAGRRSSTRRAGADSDQRQIRHNNSRHSTSSGSDQHRSRQRIEKNASRQSVENAGHRTRSRAQSSEPAASRYSRSSYGAGTARTDASTRRRAARGEQTDNVAPSSGLQAAGSSSGAGATASPRRANRKRNITIAAVVVVAVLLVGAVSAFAYINSITGALREGGDQDLRAALVETDMSKEPFYMLLLGADRDQERTESDEGDLFRSDTMILARVDAPKGTITLISIPRDTLVDLGEYGWQKINVAYGFGGPSLAVEAVSKLTGVSISHYAEIDMDGLSAIIDSIGGVEVEVPVEIDDEDAGGYVPAGWQTLDGEHALIVCRSRNTYIETSAAPDLMRAANQRMVLSAVAHKVLGSDIATIANTVRSAAGFVTTDLELNDIIGLAQALQGMNTDDAFYTASLPTRALYIANGLGYPDVTGFAATDTVDPNILEGWYCVMEDDVWATMKGRMSEGLPPAEGLEIDEATGTVLSTAGSDAADVSTKYAWITVMNGTDREGLATRVMGMLNADGFENITLEDAPYGRSYPETLVIYDEAGRAREAAQIVEALGQGRAMQNDGSWVVTNNFLVVIGDDWQGSTSSSSTASASVSSPSASAA